MGAGFGIRYVTTSGIVYGEDFTRFDATDGTFHAFGGFRVGVFTVDLEVSRVATTAASINVGVRF